MPRAEPSRAPPGPPRANLRRGRRTPALRSFFAETDLPLRRLILPIFVRPGRGEPTPIPSMPGVDRYPVGALPGLARELAQEGIASVLLFGAGDHKDAQGSEAGARDGLVPQAVRALKATTPDLVVLTDVCLCAYTTHGHCGVADAEGRVDNAATLPLLARVAMAHAAAGADLVAPSAMMDGQVAALRAGLDAEGHDATGILAYSTKHASAFYGPFREAEGSAPAVGDRRGYQLDWRNLREAMREIDADAAEGADALMVKPALTSLDLIVHARARTTLPIAAYQVSGEFAMLRAAAARGLVEERAAVEETLGAVRRAGADLVVTYFARQMAQWTRGQP